MTAATLPYTEPSRPERRRGGLGFAIPAVLLGLLAFVPAGLFIKHCITFLPALRSSDPVTRGDEGFNITVALMLSLPVTGVLSVLALVFGIAAVAVWRSRLGIIAVVLASLPPLMSIVTYLIVTAE